jgi:hypothetical protein
MQRKGCWRILLALGTLVTLVGAVVGASAIAATAVDGQVSATIGSNAFFSSARDHVLSLTRLFELVDDDEGEADDGRDLLPLAKITYEQAARAAQAAVPGSVGEIDLEYDRDRLVFDADVDGQSVKVDAVTGQVLSTGAAPGDD